MPIYEYTCKSCGALFEAMRRITDKDEDVKCPMCYEKKAVRVPSMFSGSGSSSCGPQPAGAPRRFG